MTLIKFLSKLVNKNFELNGNSSENTNNSNNNNNNNNSNRNNEIDIYNSNSLKSCNNTPQTSPQHPTTQFCQPNFFEEIKREDDSRLILAYSL